MKIGDLVTVKPAKTGVVLGKLYKLYAPELDENLVDMHEKYIEIINEG